MALGAGHYGRTGMIFVPTLYLSRTEKMILWIGICVSFYLIGVMWLRHRKDPFMKKLLWSLVLIVPVIGWVFYGAFYQPLASGDVPPSSKNDAT